MDRDHPHGNISAHSVLLVILLQESGRKSLPRGCCSHGSSLSTEGAHSSTLSLYPWKLRDLWVKCYFHVHTQLLPACFWTHLYSDFNFTECRVLHLLHLHSPMLWEYHRCLYKIIMVFSYEFPVLPLDCQLEVKCPIMICVNLWLKGLMWGAC